MNAFIYTTIIYTYSWTSLFHIKAGVVLQETEAVQDFSL